MATINQYFVVLVNLDPTIGKEMKKTRPCVVISPNEMNRYLQTIVVAPITTSSRAYPTRIEFSAGQTSGWIAIDQIRTIDRARIVKTFQSLDATTISEVKTVIRETFVD